MVVNATVPSWRAAQRASVPVFSAQSRVSDCQLAPLSVEVRRTVTGISVLSSRAYSTRLPSASAAGAAPSTNPEEIPSACRSTQRPWGTASVWTALESEPDAAVPDAVQAARENIIMPARSEDRIVCTDFMVASRQLCGFWNTGIVAKQSGKNLKSVFRFFSDWLCRLRMFI